MHFVMINPKQVSFYFATNLTVLTLLLCLSFPFAHQDALADDTKRWEGVWFTCEFAQSKRAPDDGCQMFDDEGFAYFDDSLFYLKMQNSTETACRGNKVGQCFRRDLPAITVTSKEVAEVRIEGNQLFARYLGCEQSYQFTEQDDYVSVLPNEKACFWSRERHFYIARYDGKMTIQE